MKVRIELDLAPNESAEANPLHALLQAMFARLDGHTVSRDDSGNLKILDAVLGVKVTAEAPTTLVEPPKQTMVSPDPKSLATGIYTATAQTYTHLLLSAMRNAEAKEAEIDALWTVVFASNAEPRRVDAFAGEVAKWCVEWLRAYSNATESQEMRSRTVGVFCENALSLFRRTSGRALKCFLFALETAVLQDLESDSNDQPQSLELRSNFYASLYHSGLFDVADFISLGTRLSNAKQEAVLWKQTVSRLNALDPSLIVSSLSPALIAFIQSPVKPTSDLNGSKPLETGAKDGKRAPTSQLGNQDAPLIGVRIDKQSDICLGINRNEGLYVWSTRGELISSCRLDGFTACAIALNSKSRIAYVPCVRNRPLSGGNPVAILSYNYTKPASIRHVFTTELPKRVFINSVHVGHIAGNTRVLTTEALEDRNHRVVLYDPTNLLDESRCLHHDSHKDIITCATFATKHQLIVSGSCDKTVRLWDPRSASTSLLTRTTRLTSHVTCMEATDDLVAIGGAEGVVRVWDLRKADSSAALTTTRIDTSGVVRLAISPKLGLHSVAVATRLGLSLANLLDPAAAPLPLPRDPAAPLPRSDALCDVQWSPCGSRLVTTSGHAPRFIDF
eukprot:TRINITY_DN3142_c0_g3_i1.p1 TRINITY_DN3142_c0_g3~~TRINITY_DN3142_c0_g3_i1.p1  ORF type:complete len:617 (+),score=93.08 TRINITY_DN3142_c0_g3_i1:51-1901(+)